LYSAVVLAPISFAACVTMPLAASAAMNRRCFAAVIVFRRGLECGAGVKASSGSSGTRRIAGDGHVGRAGITVSTGGAVAIGGTARSAWLCHAAWVSMGRGL
jgi:hypothetical protein